MGFRWLGLGLGEQLRLLERFLEAAQTSREPCLSGGERGPHLARVGVGVRVRVRVWVNVRGGRKG